MKTPNCNFSRLHVSLLDENARGVVLEGGSRCFAAGTPVICKRLTVKDIDDITTSDIVLTRNEDTNENEYRKVLEVHKMINTKPTIRIKLKNGESITCTDDHKFFFNGRWIEIRNILSLLKK